MTTVQHETQVFFTLTNGEVAQQQDTARGTNQNTASLKRKRALESSMPSTTVPQTPNMDENTSDNIDRPLKVSRQKETMTSEKSSSPSPKQVSCTTDTISRPNDSATPILTPQQCPSNMSPDDYIKILIESQSGFSPKTCPALSVPSDFFLTPTEEHLAAYTSELLEAVQEQEMDAIRQMHETGQSLQCCNRFGESVIHMACRRGLTQVFDFLVNEAKISIRVRDDYGRTPLHDACWSKTPNFEIIDTLLKREPSLLLITDKRGFTPFSYARMEHWAMWRQFLFDRKEILIIKPELESVFDSLE